jgi:hypothetical protein
MNSFSQGEIKNIKSRSSCPIRSRKKQKKNKKGVRMHPRENEI